MKPTENQLCNFGHPTEELFRTCFCTNNNRPQSVLFKFHSVLFGRKTRYYVCSNQLESLTGIKKLASSLPTAMPSQTKWREKFDSPTGISGIAPRSLGWLFKETWLYYNLPNSTFHTCPIYTNGYDSSNQWSIGISGTIGTNRNVTNFILKPLEKSSWYQSITWL